MSKIYHLSIILVFTAMASIVPAFADETSGSNTGFVGGATIELDQKVYTWTDIVHITVVAPSCNTHPNIVDIIGYVGSCGTISIKTSKGQLNSYSLIETGPNTGIFTGDVTLTGFPNYDAKGDGTGYVSGITNGIDSTNGQIATSSSDNIQVTFTRGSQSVTGSAIIRWNIGEVSWLQASYPSNGQGVLQTVDPDMNLNPNAIDKFDTNVMSSSDPNGINLTMTETGPDTGIFQGTVYFTTNSQSSGNMLHISEGDTVTGKYIDRTLPPPWTLSGQLHLTATTVIAYTAPSVNAQNPSHFQVLHVNGVRPHYYFYVTPFFNPYNNEIGNAMEQWHQANPNTIKFRQVSNIFTDLDLHILLEPHCSGTYVGGYSAKDHTITICVAANDQHFDRNTIYQIALHEIGHALGFPHDNNIDIMNPNLMEWSYDNCRIAGYNTLYLNETCNGVAQATSTLVSANDLSTDEINYDLQNMCNNNSGLCINQGSILPLGDISNSGDYMSLSPPSTPTAPTTGSTNTPPLIIVPQNIITNATSTSGAQVNYAVTAVSTTGILTPTCTPASGSIFQAGVTTVSCSATDSLGNLATKSFTVTVNPSSPSVPSWVRNLGAMWCSGQLNSSGFVQAIQWLITNHVIILPQTQQGSQSGTQNIPAWVKSDACFWSQGTISDQTFEQAIQYLVTNGIITT